MPRSAFAHSSTSFGDFSPQTQQRCSFGGACWELAEQAHAQCENQLEASWTGSRQEGMSSSTAVCTACYTLPRGSPSVSYVLS
eukprot:m.398304 g.398304  ORF g.398304 m.398304 type:complete len:83 (+) comp16773_c2_seq68:2135-2383(+)